jgi:predicted MFS family arabinose efflux permease
MLFAAFLINIPSLPWLAAQRTRSVWSELRDGLEYAATNRAIAYVLLIQAILALCVRPLGELLPAFIGGIFSEGAGMLAVMTSAMGVGAVVAGLRLLLWDVGRGLANLIILSTALSAVAVILFSLTSIIWLAVVIIFFVAYWVAVCGIASQTLIQSRVDETKRGRVISLWAAIYRGVPGVGALIIGALASRFGLIWPSVIAASLCAIAAAWMYTKRSVLDSEAT